jgi:hypothetical protein
MVLADHNMTYSGKVSNKGPGKEWPVLWPSLSDVEIL